MRLEFRGWACLGRCRGGVGRAEVERRLQECRTVVSFNGPYENTEVIGLMQRCHAVLVPSIWWENSPLVIQEAFAARRPVICSDIGGMAEKVRDGVDGWHFRARSAGSLADLLRGLAEEPGRVVEVQTLRAKPAAASQTTNSTIELYENRPNRKLYPGNKV